MRTGAAVAVAVWVCAGCAGAAQEMLFFRSPSGNIHCLLHDGPNWRGARCDIREGVVSFPVRPRRCTADWGRSFEVSAEGVAGPGCAGDTVADPAARVLPYGASLTLGGVTCRSERSGMTCTNRAGRGFTLARAGQRVF